MKSRSRQSRSLWRIAALGYWCALAAATHWPGLNLTEQTGVPAGEILQTDKALHGLAFALLTFLLFRARLAGHRSGPRWQAAIAPVVAGFYAVFDEWSQQFFAERTVSSSDLIANGIGVLGMFVAIWPRPARRLGKRSMPWWVWFVRAAWLVIIPLGVALIMTQWGNLMVVRYFGPYASSDLRPDKIAHYNLSIIITWVLALSHIAGWRRPNLGAFVTVAVMVLMGPMIEFAQSFTSRGVEVADVYRHELGVLMALALWAGWLIVRGRISYVLTPLAVVIGFRKPTVLEGDSAQAATAQNAAFVGHAMLMSGLTLVSRVLGLVRDAALAAGFGRGPITSAFLIGFIVPNLFRRLFGEGALSSAFIPTYTRLVRDDPAMARRFATATLGLLLLITAAITLIGEALLALVLSQVAMSEHTRLALELTVIMLPYMPAVCLVALAGGMMQVRGVFGPSAAAPIVLNVVMIAVILSVTFQVFEPDSREPAIKAVAWSVLVAGAIQLLWQLIVLWRHEPIAMHFAGVGPSLRRMMRVMLPMVFALAVFQFNAILDSLIAFGLAPSSGSDQQLNLFGWSVACPIKDAGQVASLQWAQRLYQFPLGVFGIALATAVFPALSRTADRLTGDGPDDGDAFATVLARGVRLALFVGLPASVGLAIVRLPAIRVIFERGQFAVSDAVLVSEVLLGYASAVWAYMTIHVLTRGFYALDDVRTPLRVSLVMVVINLAVNLVLVWPMGAAGLAWSTAGCATIQCLWLMRIMHRRTDGCFKHTTRSAIAMSLVMTFVMAAVLIAGLWWYDPTQGSVGVALAVVCVAVGVGVACCLVVARMLGMAELIWLIRRRT